MTNNNQNKRISLTVDFFTVIKIILFFILCLMIWYILYKKYVYIYINTKSKSELESYVLSIMVGITLMLFLVACGFNFKLTNPKLKILSFIIIFYLIYLGYTNIGLGIDFRENFELLDYSIYESNSSKGIDFFVLNYWKFWIYVYVISLFLESE